MSAYEGMDVTIAIDEGSETLGGGWVSAIALAQP